MSFDKNGSISSYTILSLEFGADRSEDVNWGNGLKSGTVNVVSPHHLHVLIHNAPISGKSHTN